MSKSNMNHKDEIWKKTIDSNYEVSNLGNVKSLPRLIHSGPKKWNGRSFYNGCDLKPVISTTTGYAEVTLGNRKRYFVHRLVAFAFCDNHFEGAVVNHKNGIRDDNRAENLEWVSHSENLIHAYRVLKIKKSTQGRFGKESNASKPIKMICLKTGKTEMFYAMMDAKRKYPFLHRPSISRCCNGKLKSHQGYKFNFLNQTI